MQSRWLIRSLVALVVVFGGGSQAAAQCRNRVLLYVDMSISMGRGENSPFDQTRKATIALLNQPGLFSNDDRFVLIEFGRTPSAVGEAQGPTEAIGMLQRLRRPDAQETDVARVFADLTRRVTEQADRNRDLVLIASDFAHDPTLKDTRDVAARLSAWDHEARIQEWAAPFEPGPKGEAPKAVLALLRAPVDNVAMAQREADQQVSDGVWQRLDAVPASHLGLSRAENAPTPLASELSKLLYVPPLVTVRLTGEHEFTVTARNVGCMPLNLVRASADCAAGAPAPVRRDFPAEERALPGIGAGVERSLALGVDELNCPDNKYKFLVTTQELGDTGTAKDEYDRKSQIESEVEHATLAPPSFFGDGRLEVRLKLWGVVLGSQQFALKLSMADGSGGPEKALYGHVQVPKDLAVQRSDAKSYRVTIPISADDQRRLKAGPPQLKVDTRDPIALVLGDDDRQASLLDAATKALLLLLAVVLVWAAFKSAVSHWEVLDRANALVGVLTSISSALPWLAGHPYNWPTWAPRALSALVLFASVLFGISVLVLRVWRGGREQRLRQEYAGGHVPASYTDSQQAGSLRRPRIVVFGVAAAFAVALTVWSVSLGDGIRDGSVETLVFEPAP